jgi:hypothetical protein
MNERPKFMTHERIMAGEEYVSYSDYLMLQRERDEARMALEEETKFHHRTHAELIQTQCRLTDVTQAIIATLEENRHLADGDDCTLAKLKSVVPDWK